MGAATIQCPQVETLTSPADTTSTVRRGADNGFWADLFPGSDQDERRILKGPGSGLW